MNALPGLLIEDWMQSDLAVFQNFEVALPDSLVSRCHFDVMQATRKMHGRRGLACEPPAYIDFHTGHIRCDCEVRSPGRRRGISRRTSCAPWRDRSGARVRFHWLRASVWRGLERNVEMVGFQQEVVPSMASGESDPFERSIGSGDPLRQVAVLRDAQSHGMLEPWSECSMSLVEVRAGVGVR